MHTTSHHLSRTVAIALVAGAVLTPVAAAQDLRSPDTRDAAERAAHAQDMRMPDTQDSAAGRGVETAPVVEFVDVPHADGFDWTDAALGAATALGIVLVGAGGAMTTARSRRRPVTG